MTRDPESKSGGLIPGPRNWQYFKPRPLGPLSQTSLARGTTLLRAASKKSMRYAATLLLSLGAIYAQNASSPAGKWISILTIIDRDNVNYDRMQLELNGRISLENTASLEDASLG